MSDPYEFKVGKKKIQILSDGSVKVGSKLTLSKDEAVDFCQEILSFYARGWRDPGED